MAIALWLKNKNKNKNWFVGKETADRYTRAVWNFEERSSGGVLGCWRRDRGIHCRAIYAVVTKNSRNHKLSLAVKFGACGILDER